MLTKIEALNRARKFLSEHLELEVHTESYHPSGIYSINPKNEILIRFWLLEEPMVGYSKFLGVSKIDGTVCFIGQKGE